MNVKQFLRRFAQRIGLDIRRVSMATDRCRLDGFLRFLSSRGFEPRTIIDVGAAWGGFTREALDLWPSANYVLFEPLDEFRDKLETLRESHDNVEIVRKAAFSYEGETMFLVHQDYVGSSVYEEQEGADLVKETRVVETTTLDSSLGSDGTGAPYLLKVDVQGAELQVLEGANGILPFCEVVILETSLFKFFVDGPTIREIIRAMDNRGFAVYDIFGHLYRPLDGALAQVDLAFVPADSSWRQDHRFANPESRHEQTRRIRENLSTLLERDQLHRFGDV